MAEPQIAHDAAAAATASAPTPPPTLDRQARVSRECLPVEWVCLGTLGAAAVGRREEGECQTSEGTGTAVTSLDMSG